MYFFTNSIAFYLHQFTFSRGHALKTEPERCRDIPKEPALRKDRSAILLKLIHFWLSPRPISTGLLHALLHFHLLPIYLVLYKGSYCFHGISHLEGGFTLRCLQRLSLPDLATLLWIWSPTGAPAVRPSRSSRTKDSSSQISCARAG